MIDLVNDNNNWINYLKSTHKKMILISYENICNNRINILKTIENFLHIDFTSVYDINPSLKMQRNALSEFYYQRFINDIKKYKVSINYNRSTGIYKIYSPALQIKI